MVSLRENEITTTRQVKEREWDNELRCFQPVCSRGYSPQFAPSVNFRHMRFVWETEGQLEKKRDVGTERARRALHNPINADKDGPFPVETSLESLLQRGRS